MKAQTLLAEAATPHPDNTISMLRAGIDRVNGLRLDPPCQRERDTFFHPV